jgi:hypothetical protein
VQTILPAFFFCQDGVLKAFFLIWAGLEPWPFLLSSVSCIAGDDRHASPWVVIGWDGKLTNFLPGMASNHDTPDFSLPGS